MKLLMLSGDISTIQGKKGPFFYTLKELSKYWKRIDVICHRVPRVKVKRLFNKVHFHVSKYRMLLGFLSVIRIGKRIIRKERPDIIISHDFVPFYNGIGAWILNKKFKVPYVSEIHHIIGYPRAATMREHIEKLLTELYIKFVKNKAEGIRFVNKALTEYAIKNLGVKRNKAILLYSVNINFDIYKKQKVNKIYDIIFVGRLESNKGIWLILNAIKSLKKEFPKIKCLLVGEGNLAEKLGIYIEKNNLKDNVIHFKWVKSALDLAKLYNQSRMLICSSYSEGGPRVALEAMACELPVLTTKVGIMVELIYDRKNGINIIWDPNDITAKVKMLLQNPGLGRSLGEKGRESVRRFAYRDVIRNYAKGIQNVAKKSLKVRGLNR